MLLENSHKFNLQFFGGRGSSSKTGGGGSSSASGQTLTISDTEIKDASKESMKKLETMAKNGEIPNKISGSREDQARIYEAIDRLYPNPPGIMNDYHIEEVGKNLEISFNYNMLHGEDTSIRLPGRDVSEAVKNGAVKYAVYQHRGPLELAASSRGMNGYSNLEMGKKWGNRLLSDHEKTLANHDIYTNIQKLFKSPISTEGKRLNESYWGHENGGWRRMK